MLTSSFDRASTSARADREAMESLVAELRTKLELGRAGGPPRSRDRHTAAGKLLPRDRVERLLDPGSAFLELSPLAALGL